MPLESFKKDSTFQPPERSEFRFPQALDDRIGTQIGIRIICWVISARYSGVHRSRARAVDRHCLDARGDPGAEGIRRT